MVMVIATVCSQVDANSQTIACGYGHSMAICTDSTVMSWGWNLSGQLGNGYPTLLGDCQCFTYVAPVAWLDSVVSIVGGEYHSVALRSDGTVRVWGLGASGQLGYGFIPGSTCTCAALPVQPVGLPPITMIAAGEDHTLAIAADSTVWAWGDNSHGQLGDGIGFAIVSPVQVVGLTGAVSIGAGNMHSLAVKSDGTVWAWGMNDHGQLGDSTYTQRLSPVQVHGLSNVVAVDGGWKHSVALKSDGTLWTWGLNNYHQLLDTVVADTVLPIPVNGLTDIRAIAVGRYHSLALANDSTVWAWGHNAYGQLGNGAMGIFTDSLVHVEGLTGIVEIAVEGDHDMVLKSDGTVRTWGYNYYGQLGDGTRIDKYTPGPVANLCPAPIALGEGSATELTGDIRFWPNPFDDRITITSSATSDGNSRFILYTLTGDVVLSGRVVANGVIDTKDLRAGCYVLRIDSSSGRSLKRTLVVKM
jgi:alpha-tubulin suppressor-like RCC1 family protein